MKEIYSDIILDNYRRPNNYGKIKNPDFYSLQENTFCGDEIEVYIKKEKGAEKIKEIKFTGSGCVISQATASILIEHFKGKPINKIKQFSLVDLIKLLGIELSPTRLRCAELSLIALKDAVKKTQ